MIFIERKLDGEKYSYELEEIFGTLKIESDKKLNGDLLDELVSLLLTQNISAEIINGEAVVNPKTGEKIKYVFKKRPMWEIGEKDDDEICNDTTTPTEEQESESPQIAQ